MTSCGARASAHPGALDAFGAWFPADDDETLEWICPKCGESFTFRVFKE